MRHATINNQETIGFLSRIRGQGSNLHKTAYLGGEWDWQETTHRRQSDRDRSGLEGTSAPANLWQCNSHNGTVLARRPTPITMWWVRSHNMKSRREILCRKRKVSAADRGWSRCECPRDPVPPLAWHCTSQYYCSFPMTAFRPILANTIWCLTFLTIVAFSPRDFSHSSTAGCNIGLIWWPGVPMMQWLDQIVKINLPFSSSFFVYTRYFSCQRVRDEVFESR